VVVVRLSADKNETEERKRGESRREDRGSGSLAATTAVKGGRETVTWAAHVGLHVGQDVLQPEALYFGPLRPGGSRDIGSQCSTDDKLRDAPKEHLWLERNRHIPGPTAVEPH
jgi:hypothetical protein